MFEELERREGQRLGRKGRQGMRIGGRGLERRGINKKSEREREKGIN